MSTPDTRNRRQGDIRAIFVHAGAGYHSVQNERVHLKACEDACKAAMVVLKSGGTAVDAVEIAIKVLEDREITNAGYGSNLAMDGVVECDAVVVDHFGRSGAAGAVAQVQNPISLARLILDHSTRPLTLRRVAPNLLVGQGATDFAAEQNIPILPHDALISPAAQERWLRWSEDLKKAERKAREQGTQVEVGMKRKHRTPYKLPRDAQLELIREHHARQLANPSWKKPPRSPPSSEARQDMSSPGTQSVSSTTASDLSELPRTPGAKSTVLASTNPFMNSTQKIPTLADVPDSGASDTTYESSSFAQVLEDQEVEMTDVDDNVPEAWHHRTATGHTWHDGSSSGESESSRSTLQLPSLTPSPPSFEQTEASNIPIPPTPLEKAVEDPSPAAGTPLGHRSPGHREPPLPPVPPTTPLNSSPTQQSPRPLAKDNDREDLITDTVGAIAIDVYGNIAAGASSGGIGMKYRGRIGPAALVGVGAAVVPVQQGDNDNTCVAAVTSGTGEHMTTTMAAGVCAERLYHGVKKDGNLFTRLIGSGGVPVGNVDGAGHGRGLGAADHDDDVLRSFVEHDFMGHPSVKNGHCAGAIGVLAIKKTREGAYLYFAHNTDSFALASMHANEPKPVVCMSRSPGGGAIAQGGRAMRFKKKR